MPQSNSAPPIHILIVDDDADDHYFLRRAINKQVPNALIESLYDGAEALLYLEKNQSLPHLVILDLNMARISGQNTIKLIRANPALEKVPVVIFTTSRNEDERTKMLGLGAQDFFTKPADQEGLNDFVKKVKTRWLNFKAG